MQRRFLWVVLAIVSVTGLVFGTVGFETTAMDRGVGVTVSDHDRALVTLWDPGVGKQGRPPDGIVRAGLVGEDPVTEDGQSIRVVAVLNRFSDRSITVDATVLDAPQGVVVGPFDPVTLAPGAAAALEAPVQCADHSGPTPITLRVRASNDQFSGVITFDAIVVCAIPTPPEKTVNEGTTEPRASSGTTNETATE
jgi:hypothetical protein